MLLGTSVTDLSLACDAALRVVARRGMESLSVRAIAAEMNVTGPALTQRWDNRARLWRLLVHEVGERWLSCVRDDATVDGPLGLLPSTDERVADARAWLMFRTLARDDAALAAVVGDVDDRERGELRWAVERGRRSCLPVATLELRHATLLGLRARVCDTDQPLPAATARALWASALAEADVEIADVDPSQDRPATWPPSARDSLTS